MELELKHLAPYLPYNLKGNAYSPDGYYEPIEEGELMRIETGITRSGDTGERWLVVDDIEVAIVEFTPNLRLLSDLTNEIEHNGERFVPICELAKIGTKEDKCYITNGNFSSCYVDALNEKKGFFFYQSSGYFIWQVGKNAEPRIVQNQMLLFQKLHEWHFDIHGLIEKGLAVDINTINK